MNLKKLAEELNLSFSTVSKALRDSHEISVETKNRVIAKANELNYQVNPLASSFRKQKTKTIALIIPEVVNDFFGPVINGMETIAQEKGYHVLVYMTHEDREKEIAIFKLLQTGRVDGIMLSLSEQTSDISHLRELKERGIPLILFDRITDQMEVTKVTTDNETGGKRATTHLIERGCRRIAFLGISRTLSVSTGRMHGYLDALKENSMNPEDELILCCDGDDNKNKELIRALLLSKNRPDGIFASVETLAISTYEVCEELGLNIPKDVKVIAFSNSYMAALLNPSLSAIAQPAFEMGREAAAILVSMVEKKESPFRPQKTEIKSRLIVRNSTK
jgi:LacI family transcriptional regulator